MTFDFLERPSGLMQKALCSPGHDLPRNWPLIYFETRNSEDGPLLGFGWGFCVLVGLVCLLFLFFFLAFFFFWFFFFFFFGLRTRYDMLPPTLSLPDRLHFLKGNSFFLLPFFPF